MASKKRGLTIIELLAGLFVVFLSVCTLGGVMVSTHNYFHRLQDRTIAVQLAENLVKQSLWEGCDAGFSQPGFKVNDDWEGTFPLYNATFGNMKGFSVEVTGPSGMDLEIERGYHNFGQGGLAVSNAGLVGYGIYFNSAETIGIFDDVANAPARVNYPKMPVRAWSNPGHVPIQPNPSGMTWDSTNNILYVSDGGTGFGTYALSNPGSAMQSWNGTPTNPMGPQSVSLCLDSAFNVWGTAGHNVWNTAATNMGTNITNIPPYMPLPPTLPLGEAVEIAVDPRPPQNSFWVTDEKFMCVRHFLGGGVAPTFGFEPYQYKPPAGTRMGSPVLMTMTITGVLVIYDGTSIWQFPNPSGGVLTPGLSFPLAGFPSGPLPTLMGHLHAIGSNSVYNGGTYVFFTDTLDRIYRYDVTANSLVLR